MKKSLKIILSFIGTIVIIFSMLMTYFAMNRDKIHDRLLTSMREKLQAKVAFDKLEFSLLRDFPLASIELKNVLIADSLYDLHRVPLIKSKSIFLQTSIWNLVILNLEINKIVIEDAGFTIFKRLDGYSNDYILNNLSNNKKEPTPEKKEKSTAEFDIQKIGLYKVNISINDSLNAKRFAFNFKDVVCKLIKTEEQMDVFVKGDIFMGGLTFKERKGTFIQNQNLFLDAHFKSAGAAGTLEILPSTLNIGTAHFDLKGHIKTAGKGELKLMLHNDAVSLADAKNILTKKIYSKLEQFSFGGAMNTDVSIQTPLKGGGHDPFITVNAIANGIPVNIDGNEIDSAFFHGTFKNYIDSLSEPGDENSTITFPDFRGIANGIGVKGVVKIISFSNARLELDVKGQGELSKLQNFLNENSMLVKGGNLDFNIIFKANVSNMYDSINDKINGAMSGDLHIKNGTIYSVSKNVSLTDINSTITIDQNGLHIKQMEVKAPGSDLNITGDAEKVLLFLFSDKSKLKFNCKLYSDNLNLEPVFSENKSKEIKPAKKKNKIEQTVSNSVDRILRQSDVDINFKCKHVYVRKFNAYDGTGKISINNNSASISEFSFSHAHGKIKYDAQLTKKSKGYEAKFTANVANVSMPDFMEAFENFKQQSLTKKNISGTVNLNINATCDISNGFTIVPNSLHGDLKFNLLNGELNNFEPLVNLSKYIFKNRGLDSIKFTTLSCTADIEGNEIYVNKLYVLSTALSLAMDGTYSFGDNTDLSIQVPLKNLKSNSPQYFTTVENFDKYKGANIFIRGKTEDGKLSFSYDPLKKLRKKKKK